MKDIKVDTNKVTANDYPELEGKFITYTMEGRDWDGNYEKIELPCVVVGVNRHLGITVVHANDKDDFVVCFAGPIMPDFQLNPDLYDAYFDECVKCIEEGIWPADRTLNVIFPSGSNGGNILSGDACAYSR